METAKDTPQDISGCHEMKLGLQNYAVIMPIAKCLFSFIVFAFLFLSSFIHIRELCDVNSLAAYHAHLIIFLYTDACNWLCMSAYTFIAS
jgi:hypothetical protein